MTSTTETMKEGWARNLHEKLAQDYDALMQRDPAYAKAKAAADYLDDKKTAETRAYLQKAMPSHLALFDKTVAEQKTLAAAPNPAEPLRLELLLDVNSETRIYLPVKQGATIALCKDLYDHVQQVASASLNTSAGTLPFGDYLIVKASGANIKELEELLGRTPPAFDATKISVGALSMHLKLPALPSNEEHILPLRQSYIDMKKIYVPAPLEELFPEPTETFVLDDSEDKYACHTWRSTKNQLYIQGARKFFDKHKPKDGNKISVREIKPMEVYGVTVLRTR